MGKENGKTDSKYMGGNDMFLVKFSSSDTKQ